MSSTRQRAGYPDPVRSRPFNPDDVPRLHDLVADVWAARGPSVTFHVGDLHWRLRTRRGSDPEVDIQVWEDDHGVLGFAWYDPFYEGDTQGGVRSGSAVEDSMLAWMERRARAAGCGFVDVRSFEGDAARHALLAARGYVRQSGGYAHMMCALGGEHPEVPLPAGLSLRSVTSRGDYARRVQIEGLAFGRGGPFADAWVGLERDALYRMEHDFVVEGADEFLAFSTVWTDDRNRVGLFEPVGCHPDHRRRGLATAVIVAGLRALERAGMTRAVVYPERDNTAAIAMYESCSFTLAATQFVYRGNLTPV
jgi:GNAT superfamily N-acetyltransferase